MFDDGKDDGFKLACKDLEVKKMAMGEESAMPRGWIKKEKRELEGRQKVGCKMKLVLGYFY